MRKGQHQREHTRRSRQGLAFKAGRAQEIREGMIAELGAINEYERFAEASKDPKVKKVIDNITREEKTHFGEFQTVLLKMDSEQKKQLLVGKKEADEAMNGT